MKYIYLLIIVAALSVSCSEKKKNSVEYLIENGNLKTLREKRGELVGEQQAINDKIKLLDEKIKTVDTTKNVPLITTFKTKTQVFNHVLELQGNVTTKNLLTITPEYNGILTHVYVKEGQKVTKGQTLAKIDDGGLSQQLAQLKIQAELAKTTYERQQRLWEQNIGSEIQYLQSKSTYQSQQEAVNQLYQQIAKTTVKAPFSGTIDDIITEQGSVVAAGQSPLMRIVNLDNMYIETEVPESYVSNVTKGKNVSVNIPVLGQTIETKIRQAGDFINPSNRTFKIEVEIPNKDKAIKPNLSARLKINDYTSEKAILIPQSVVSENAEGEQYVYVVNDKNEKGIGTAERIIIKTGKTQGDIIEILEGLSSGAEIIQEGARSVRDGQSVEVINYETKN
ncbi:efflux RND transporter periplasmic adaptor subunit [Winogradskyella undariae]|uniref:efflux RND transporter periplasmic adaptor subunit n=1 Tax=Winogradskyella undariae TaxID=1285465 RepID=UPI0015CCB239|nr:efflux RND transporter periplasmic adaptor subunit [Winogradskyella undariae]